MRISIDPGEVLSFQLRMGKRRSNIKEAKENILKKAVFIVEKYGKYYAPVKTGRLRASIGGGSFSGGNFGSGEGIDFSRLNESLASIGPTVIYAKYVHNRIPFMSAGAQDSLGEIEKVAQQEIRKALQ